MAAKDPAQEFEKGFGGGLRAQLDKRRGEVEAAAKKVAANKAAKKLEQPAKLKTPEPVATERAEPAPVRIVPDQPPRSQELMEERKALDVRAKELAETKEAWMRARPASPSSRPGSRGHKTSSTSARLSCCASCRSARTGWPSASSRSLSSSRSSRRTVVRSRRVSAGAPWSYWPRGRRSRRRQSAFARRNSS